MVETDYSSHITRSVSGIESVVDEMPTQPILFLGNGLSIRYFGAPSWVELLKELADRCPLVEREITYFLQRGDSEPEIGSYLSEQYYEWAYGAGRSRFPDSLYDDTQYDQDIFIKHEITDYLDNITPESLTEIDQQYHEEIKLLHDMTPHAVITTNYDRLVDLIFPDHKPYIGEEVLTSPHQNIGEIFKIHGSVDTPEKLVLTEEDYDTWEEQRKYISAKLVTYFSEHPVLIAGYGVTDRNVRRVLADIDKILAPEGGLVENIYFLQFEDEAEIQKRRVYDSQRRFETINGGDILLNHVIANGFEHVFKAFGSGGFIGSANLTLLRSVMAHTYDVIAKKAPRKEVEINYEALKIAAEREEVVGTLMGVTLLDNPPDLNIFYRYRTTDIADELGYSHFNYVVQLLEQIEEETGTDIRDSNNKYHIDIAFQSDNAQHRYSDEAVHLLEKVKNGDEYELTLNQTELDMASDAPRLLEAD